MVDGEKGRHEWGEMCVCRVWGRMKEVRGRIATDPVSPVRCIVAVCFGLVLLHCTSLAFEPYLVPTTPLHMEGCSFNGSLLAVVIVASSSPSSLRARYLVLLCARVVFLLLQC